MHTTTLTQGVESQLDSAHHAVRPTFSIACWLLALLAFGQLLTVGTALAVRSGQPVAVAPVAATEHASVTFDEPIEPRSIEKIIQDAENSSGQIGGSAMASVAERGAVRIQPAVSEATAVLVEEDLQPAVAHGVARIANPRVERLVQQSRTLHLEGDMMRAMLKLDEAGRIDPFECAVIYEKGLLFEDMGIYTKAADQYQQIQQMGLIKAGAYFHLAASKLTKGMDTASARRSSIAIGPMKVNKGSGANAGRHVEVAVTLLARPDQLIQPDDVVADVHFYDKVNGGEIKKAAENAIISRYWADSKVDWQGAGSEETFRVSYTIPQANFADEHLLGRREFYGYVVELVYKGEVVDQRAHPTRLHSIHREKMAPVFQEDYGMPWLPHDDNGLLPGKDEAYGLDAPLPSR